jgi:hypothetical protein
MANPLGPTPIEWSGSRTINQWISKLINRVSDASTTSVGTVKQASAVADLNQTIAGPSIAEVQAISDKVVELLAAMRTAGSLDT